MGIAEESWTATAHRLVTWYKGNKRQMPWRETRDPYAIWVSETMLQQTRVETVIPYFHAFLQQFPTVGQLAQADSAVVLKSWQGLGYYSRARNLHAAAKEIVDRYGGVIPTQLEDFRSLSGVGPYTGGAVFSIAFNKPVPAVDGNVLRVMSRYLGIHEPIEKASVKQRIRVQVEAWLAHTEPRDMTQALMELGAMVCVPRSPSCLVCPLQGECTAYAMSTQEQLPLKTPKKARKVVNVHALWCEEDGKVLMLQRPAQGLLASMWQLPHVEVAASDVPSAEKDGENEEENEEVHSLLRRQMAYVAASSGGGFVVADPTRLDFVPIAKEKHVFTHMEWHVTVYRPVGWPLNLATCPVEVGVPTAREDIPKLALPRVYEKLIQQIMEG